MAKHLLVSNPDRDGDTRSIVLCDRCLKAEIKHEPLIDSEWLVDADDDDMCENCGG